MVVSTCVHALSQDVPCKFDSNIFKNVKTWYNVWPHVKILEEILIEFKIEFLKKSIFTYCLS
jgi:hypothetical protein